MPRAPVAGREIRRRSRNGCWNCKARKVKCGEEKPRCANCTRLDEDCDYKIRLSWGGRPLKKKLLEQGAQIDDPSQNIPGAGQFSINSFNPAPSHSHSHSHTHSHTRLHTSSPSTPTTPSTSRPSTSVKKSKQMPKAGLPVYQNVFPVCGVNPQGAMMPVSTMPNSQYCIAPAYPQHSMYPGLWTSEGEPQQPLTPLSTLASESHYPLKEESYAQYASGAGSFVPQVASPTPSLATLAMTSPTSATNSSMPSPQQSFTDHVICNQHTAMGSPSGHMKTGSSPEVQYRIMPQETTAAMSAGLVVPSSGAMCNPMEYMNGPLTPPTEGHMYPNKENARRLSVQNLLAAPVPSSQNFAQYNPNIVPSSHFPGENMPAIDPSLEDAEVEEIQRYDPSGNMIQKKGQSQQPFLGVSGPLGSVNGHSVYHSIPRSLHPLPAMLMDNVESAMYFHHFLTHTASLLVPHDCGRNPFKTILPQMAMQTDSLLNLLLAYSASHQSRLLKNPEPTARISGFLGETVRSLTESLNDPVAQKSDATLTTAIMLCSYEIISPNSFAEGITWQTHLNAVRRIILARGGVDKIHSRDEISYFLSRWFAYLDVLGSLSGKDTQIPLFKGDYWILDESDEMKEFSVDCFFGTTNRFISLLARVGDLARKCDDQKRQYVDRIRSLGYSSTASEWMPDGNIYQDTVNLKNELEESRHRAMGSCNHKSHGHDDDEEDFRHMFDPANHERDQQELLATNDAYHWAAQIHLARRVFNFPTQHENVQDAVGHIISALHKVKEDGTAINCWLFPMFIAGCESVNPDDRSVIRQRMLVMEGNGLTQIQKARFLMEKVWTSGNPWELMTNGEFIG